MARRGAGAVALLVAVLTGLLLSGPALADEHPELEGRPVEDALALLEQAGLEAVLDPDALPEGVERSRVVVVRQSALTEPDGGVYGWVLHLGAAVPDLVGRTLGQAQAELEAHGLAAKARATQDPDDLVVVGQDPGPGALVGLGEAVGLTVVPGVQVPDVVGLPLAEAADAVESLSLEIDASGGGSSPGAVEAQDPPAGALVAPGTRVSVRLAAAASPLVRVPDLSGSDVEQARRLLAEVGLTLEATVQGDQGEARLVSQDPAAGTLVQPGSVVSARFEATPVGTTPVAAEADAVPWALVAAAVAAAIASAGGAVLWRLARRARERTWVRQNVSCRGDTGVAPDPRAEGPDVDLCLAVRVDVHTDPGQQELEEVRP